MGYETAKTKASNICRSLGETTVFHNLFLESRLLQVCDSETGACDLRRSLMDKVARWGTPDLFQACAYP